MLRRAHPTVHPEEASRMALKGTKDTMHPDGLLPTLLVFLTLMTLPFSSTELPTQRERLAALKTSRKEIATVISAERISTALSYRQSTATRYSISRGDFFRTYRERSCTWEGPFRVQRVSGKNSFILDAKGRIIHFTIAQLLPERREGNGRHLRVELALLRDEGLDARAIR